METGSTPYLRAVENASGEAKFKMIARLLCFLILLGVPSLADPLQDRIQRTQERLEQLYSLAGPEVGCYLYEPCYVLAFADLRPEGGWNGGPLPPEDWELIKRLDRVALSFGCSLRLTPEGSLSVLSLKGLELVSSETRFPWAPGPFQSDEGFAGWQEWSRVALRNLQATDASDPDGIHTGLMFGYPDSAISSFMADAYTLIPNQSAVHSGITGADRLVNGQPDFLIMPQDIKAPDVVRTVERWGEFLDAFYRSPQVLARLKDPRFREARVRRGTLPSSEQRERWDRGENLASRILFEPARDHKITRADELALLENIDELELLIRKEAPPFEWVELLQRRAVQQGLNAWVTPEKVQRWLWFGGYVESVEHRRRFSKAVLEVKPAYFQDVCRERLEAALIPQNEDRSAREQANEVAYLLAHPEFIKYFKALNRDQKAPFVELVRTLLDDEQVQRVLPSSPVGVWPVLPQRSNRH